MENETTGKRGRRAVVKVEQSFSITLNKPDGDYGDRKYLNVTAANFAEAGKMADSLAQIYKLNVVEISA